MRFFKNKPNWRLILSTIGTSLLFFMGSTQFTYADVGSMIIGSVSSSAISTIAYVISYLLAFIFGVLIAIEAWMIGIVLNINANILQTTLVQTGFSISLSIVNLIFVLGIIVIALATILRNNTYGIKQLLWKLVVMAIIVNFGLVIMSPIFALGNSFTQYFLDCINPGSGGCTQSASGISSFNNFGTTMAAAFSPNNALTAPATVTSTAGLGNITGGFNVSAAGASIGQSAVSLFGIIFSAIDLILIVIVLGGFIALLVVRYLYIAILAISLPFAWASWVFPGFSSHWKKWWELFIRWTFFAPIVLFFVYLALLTMKGVGSTGVFDVATYTTNNSTWSAISGFLTSAIAPIMTSFVQEILLAGLIIGGMMAANSMGIKMAGAVVDVAKKGGDMAKKAASSRAKRVASYPLRTQRGRNITQKIQTLGAGSNMVGRALTAPIRRAGNVLADRRDSTEKLVSERQKEVGKKSLLEQARRFGTQDTPGKLAILTNIDKALKDKDPKKAAEIKKALETLPNNIQKVLTDLRKASTSVGPDASIPEKAGAMWNNKNQLDRLKVLYGKNEPHADGGNDAQKALDAHRAMMAKKEAKGEEVTSADREQEENLERAVKAMEEIAAKAAPEKETKVTTGPIIVPVPGSKNPPRSSVTFNADGSIKPKDGNS